MRKLPIILLLRKPALSQDLVPGEMIGLTRMQNGVSRLTQIKIVLKYGSWKVLRKSFTKNRILKNWKQKNIVEFS
ncbi:hypothetical protein D3C74_267500 [compost metagenome]